MIDLLSRLVVYNPKDRLTAEEALQHEYFNPQKKPPYNKNEFRGTIFAPSTKTKDLR